MNSLTKLFDQTKELGLELDSPEVNAHVTDEYVRQASAQRYKVAQGKQRKERIKTNVIVAFCTFLATAFVMLSAQHDLASSNTTPTTAPPALAASQSPAPK